MFYFYFMTIYSTVVCILTRPRVGTTGDRRLKWSLKEQKGHHKATYIPCIRYLTLSQNFVIFIVIDMDFGDVN